MSFVVEVAGVGLQRDFAVTGGQPRAGAAVHETVVPQAIGNEIGNRYQFEATVPGQPSQIRKLRGSPVAVEDFTEDSSGLKPGEAGQVQRSLGVPRPAEHTSLPGPHREDASRNQEIVGGKRPNPQSPECPCSTGNL